MNKLEINPICRRSLSTGVAELGLNVPVEQQELLLGYVALLHHWNQTFNLTAVRDQTEMVSRHLLDSLATSPYLRGDTILDAGTGPGLPGIPLAITQPQKKFTLLDSNGKKIRFVRQAVMELGLENVQAEQGRVEAFHPEQGFDMVITRAFSSLAEILAMTRHLLLPRGSLLAMKGRQPEEELAKLDPEGLAIKVIPLKAPCLEGERHLVIITL